MMTKSLIAAAAIATVAAAVAAPAQAKTDIDLYFGLGGYEPGYYYEPEPRYHRPEPRYHRPAPRYYEEPQDSYGSACEDGINEVRAAGFRKVRVLDCTGRTFTYKARKHGNAYVVTVKRKSGNIIAIEQVW